MRFNLSRFGTTYVSLLKQTCLRFHFFISWILSFRKDFLFLKGYFVSEIFFFARFFVSKFSVSGFFVSRFFVSRFLFRSLFESKIFCSRESDEFSGFKPRFSKTKKKQNQVYGSVKNYIKNPRLRV